MPFDRPSLADLESALQAEITSRIPGTDPKLRNSYLGALARSTAGAVHELFGFLEWIADQAFPDTAESAELARWAAIWGLERAAAVEATGSITVTGTASTSIPSGTVWSTGARQDYESTAAATIGTTGSVVIAVRGVDAGAAGNAVSGTVASLVSPISGVVSAASVTTALTGGADIESDTSLRDRLLLRLQNPPRGGTSDDYVAWSRAAHSSVTRAWGRPLAGGLGTVTVYFMTDDATTNGIPTGAVVTAVDDYIDERRPVTALVTVSAPTAEALDVTIDNLDPSETDVMDAIEAELADLVLRESEPGGTIQLSHIREAISTAAGEIDHDLTAPTSDVAVAGTEISVIGTVTFS